MSRCIRWLAKCVHIGSVWLSNCRRLFLDNKLGLQPLLKRALHLRRSHSYMCVVRRSHAYLCVDATSKWIGRVLGDRVQPSNELLRLRSVSMATVVQHHPCRITDVCFEVVNVHVSSERFRRHVLHLHNHQQSKAASLSRDYHGHTVHTGICLCWRCVGYRWPGVTVATRPI